MPFQVEPYDLHTEQLEFREMLRRFFDDNAPVAEARRVVETDGSVSHALWKRCCEELGLPGLAIAEAQGGQGFGLPELALALGEAGRCLAPIPLLASAGMAARVLARLDGAEPWLQRIAEGEIATLAFMERGGRGLAGETRTEAHGEGSTARLRGEKHFVLHGLDAETFFVVAREPGSSGRSGLGLFAVERNAPGVHVQSLATLDVTRKLSTLRLEDAAASVVGASGTCAAALEAALDESTALLCAEMVGSMECVLETAVAYAGSRFQFGRAIGSFQAIKHKCADMLIDLEGARTATRAALDAHAEGDPERATLTSVAKSHTSQAYVRMATDNLQIHGGVGYTWEYDAHLFYRRAKSCELLLGDPALHHERLAQALARDADNGELA